MSPVLFEINDAVAFITLNRPEKRNSFNREMALSLQAALDECAANRAVRAVYLTGAGKAFSAGQDLAEAIDPNGPGIRKILLEHFNPLVKKIRRMEKPVIAAVNGVAAGAGANIALCCDIVVAAVSATFIQAFSRIGLVPDTGGSYFLPRLVGWQKASALMMLGDNISSAEAERSGMIYKVIADDQFDKESKNIAVTVSQMPTKGLALTKKALQFSMENGLDDQLQLELELQELAGQSFDHKEGVNAFIEKRNPQFRGD